MTIRGAAGGGRLISMAGTVPGAGAEVQETVPAGKRWRILAFSATLITAVAVANRLLRMATNDGVNAIIRGPYSPSVQAASLSYIYQWQPGIPEVAVRGALNLVAIPQPIGYFLDAGHKFGTSTDLLQAADQWSQIRYLVEEYDAL